MIANNFEILITKLSLLIILPIIVFHLLSCSSLQQIDSGNSTIENKPRNIEEENFAKEQTEKFEATNNELERNRRLWQGNKIVDYDFVVWKLAGGVNGWSPALIKVREGEIISIEAASKSDFLKIDGYENFDTVEKLFNYMRLELENGKIIIAKYNKKFGYPEEVHIVFSYAIHGGHTIKVTKFEIIK